MVSFAEGAMPPFANPLVRQIWVGREERGYTYSRLDDVGWLWTCARPSFVGEQRGGNLVLYLVWLAVHGFWYAIDAPDDLDGRVPAILRLGHPIFRTCGNAVSAGSCIWELNQSGPGKTAVWQRLCAFTTVVLH